MAEEHVKKTCVQDLIKGIQKERREIDSKARDIHSRAEEMVKDGAENMSKGIEAVAKGISAKSRDIHARAAEMTAEGEKRMSAGIEAVKQGIKEQTRENSAAIKEMDKGVKAIQNKIDQMGAHIRGHEKEVAHYVHVFYYGEEGA